MSTGSVIQIDDKINNSLTLESDMIYRKLSFDVMSFIIPKFISEN